MRKELREDMLYDGTMIVQYPSEDGRRKRFKILLKAMLPDSQKYVTVGEISGWYYFLCWFDGVEDLLAYTDDWDGDEFAIVDEVSQTGAFDFCDEFITIDRVYVLPQYRNKGFAKEAMTNIRRILHGGFGFSEDAIVGLIANPFEIEGEKEPMNLSLSNIRFLSDEDSSKLMSFYKKVGFVRIGDSRVFAKGI